MQGGRRSSVCHAGEAFGSSSTVQVELSGPFIFCWEHCLDGTNHAGRIIGVCERLHYKLSDSTSHTGKAVATSPIIQGELVVGTAHMMEGKLWGAVQIMQGKLLGQH